MKKPSSRKTFTFPAEIQTKLASLSEKTDVPETYVVIGLISDAYARQVEARQTKLPPGMAAREANERAAYRNQKVEMATTGNEWSHWIGEKQYLMHLTADNEIGWGPYIGRRTRRSDNHIVLTRGMIDDFVAEADPPTPEDRYLPNAVRLSDYELVCRDPEDQDLWDQRARAKAAFVDDSDEPDVANVQERIVSGYDKITGEPRYVGEAKRPRDPVADAKEKAELDAILADALEGMITGTEPTQ